MRLEIPCGEHLSACRLLQWRTEGTVVAFVKVAEPLDPVKLVHELCADALRDPQQKRSRWIQRMTPMTLMRKTMSSGLEELTEMVLKPHFHSGGPSKKVSLQVSTLFPYPEGRMGFVCRGFEVAENPNCLGPCQPSAGDLLCLKIHGLHAQTCCRVANDVWDGSTPFVPQSGITTLGLEMRSSSWWLTRLALAIRWT